MQIPETPSTVEQLDLMKQLDAYASGSASWMPDGSPIGENAKKSCRVLHTSLVQLVNGIFAYLLDRVTAREMETFTMHDRTHGRKVAHLMWHILETKRRERLTPPEIGILVIAAHLHDLGMGLSPEERRRRMDPGSDLWDRIEIDDSVKAAIDELRKRINDPNLPAMQRSRAEQDLFQAEEALLSQDTRERHATKERYEELVGMLSEFHKKEPTKIPDVESGFSFDGDSFRNKLIDVCVSHNEDADALVGSEEGNYGRPRFPRDFPVGCCVADLHLVAAALRLADILDFDRERTPPVLFHYLLPGTLGPSENRSVLEWGKHLAISNWHIEKEAVVFRGRSKSHILHHAVVQFCSSIAHEISSTKATFDPLGEASWPFILPTSVKAEIHEEGYRYVPYRFELDDERVYTLLMGGAIYDNPLVAVRELIQNAVDACKLRDSLSSMYEPFWKPSSEDRIVVRYEEPTLDCPQVKLSVTDTGTGMDAYVIERYLLKVGRSYYSSSDFNQTRVELRKHNLDFAPVSEFGIGFLSTFLLANHVEVESAMWESPRSDTTKRTLKIDGPTRLIRLDEERNDGPGRFKGTRITLFLSGGTPVYTKDIEWADIRGYIRETCQDLPYVLRLELLASGRVITERLEPIPLEVQVPPSKLLGSLSIPVDDQASGLKGQIVLINEYRQEELLRERARVELVAEAVEDDDERWKYDSLLRGGFRIGAIPGLPENSSRRNKPLARIRLTWESTGNRRFSSPNLARNNVSALESTRAQVLRVWLTYLIENPDLLPEGMMISLDSGRFRPQDCLWLETYTGLQLYDFAKKGWFEWLRVEHEISDETIAEWEQGSGVPLEAGRNLHWRILELLLPHVTSLQINEESTRLLPPRPGWRAELEGLKDFASSPIQWPTFVEFVEPSRGLLATSNYGYLNQDYRARFSSLEHADIIRLPNIFYFLILGREYGHLAELNAEDIRLLHRAIEVAGDLKIGTPRSSWSLESFSKRI